MAKLSTAMPAVAVLLLSFAAASLAGDSTISAACEGTAYPAVCVSALSVYNDPKKTYKAAELAKIEVQAGAYALLSASTSAGAQQWNDENMPQEDYDCFHACRDKFVDAHKVLEPSSGLPNIADVRSFLADAKEKKVEWNCDACRHGEDKKKVDEISKGGPTEKFMEILPVLLDRALGAK